MKKVYYENGPDRITVGHPGKEIAMKRGKPMEMDDQIAASLLKKPMFKETKKDQPQRS